MLYAHSISIPETPEENYMVISKGMELWLKTKFQHGGSDKEQEFWRSQRKLLTESYSEMKEAGQPHHPHLKVIYDRNYSDLIKRTEILILEHSRQ